MAWTKHFKAVPKTSATYVSSQRADLRPVGENGTSAKYSSILPEVYAGHPQRIQRYFQYADMNRDSDVSVALTLIADFCTQSEEQVDNPFQIEFFNHNNEGSENEVKVLNVLLTKWVKVNNFRRRMWHIFRQTIMNGDSFFLRDPETHEWTWLDHFSVVLVKVDEEKGKTPVAYAVRGLDLSRKAKYATHQVDTSITSMGGNAAVAFSGRGAGPVQSGGQFSLAGSHMDQQPGKSTQDISLIDAKHVVHLSLSIGMDTNWPFGESVLDPLFKTFKQKEMLEEAIIIYRVQRAPERRVFYIDVGDMPPHKQQALLTKVKNEMHARRIPTRNGGGTGSMVDGAYSPVAMMDDYYFANTSNGRGSKVDTLPGGENVGQIGDVDYFNSKFARALGIPPSYLAIDPEKSNVMYNDGKGGGAAIQEFRFNKLCLRLQALLEPSFDEEFKSFVKESGGNVDNEIFELRFNPPQNFAKYRQIDLDTAQMSVFAQVAQNPIFSKRFILERFANMTEDEIQRNEELWAEENPDRVSGASGGDAGAGDPGMGGGGADFGDLGIRSGGGDDLGLGDEAGADPSAGADPMAGGAPGGDAGPVDAGGGAPPAPPPA